MPTSGGQAGDCSGSVAPAASPVYHRTVPNPHPLVNLLLAQRKADESLRAFAVRLDTTHPKLVRWQQGQMPRLPELERCLAAVGLELTTRKARSKE